MLKVKIYVADLYYYNNGNLKGKWITLPIDEDDLKEEMKFFKNNDYAIHDYESPFTISEYDNIFKLNELVTEYQQKKLTEIDLIMLYTVYTDKDDIFRAIEQGYYIIDDVTSWLEIAKKAIDDQELYFILPFNMEAFDITGIGNFYLDKNSIARELEIYDNLYINKELKKAIYLY